MTFISNPRRDASATIAGFVFQVNVTILHWLELQEGEHLELERGEDIDTVHGGNGSVAVEARLLEQVKIRSGRSLTLKSEEALEALSNFCGHRTANPTWNLKFRYITTANSGVEQGWSRADSGIETWTALQRGRYDDTTRPEALAALRTFLRSCVRPEKVSVGVWEALQQVLASDDDAELSEIISTFEWGVGSGDYFQVEKQIVGALTRYGQGMTLDEASQAYEHLFAFVFRLLCQPIQKLLTKAGLISELQTPSVTQADRDALELIRHELEEVTARVVAVENVMAHQVKEMVTLKQAVGLVGKSLGFDAAFALGAISLSTDLPELVAPCATRDALVNDLLGRTQAGGMAALVGEPGSGKTQLLALVVGKSKRRTHWLNLPRAVTEYQACILIEALVRSVGHQLEDIPFRESCDAAAEQFRGALVVVEDLPWMIPGGPLAIRIDTLARCLKSVDAHLLTSSYFRLPATTAEALGKVHYDVPRFTTVDIEELLVAASAPAQYLKESFCQLLEGVTGGLPALVMAAVRYLANQNWNFSATELESLFRGEFAQALRHDVGRLLLVTVPNAEERELLIRMSLAIGALTMEDIAKVARVGKGIPLVGEKVQRATGLWLQRVGPGRFLRSPLITSSLADSLDPETRKDVHVVLALRILARKRLEPIEVLACVTHLVAAEEIAFAVTVVIQALGGFLELDGTVEDDFVFARMWPSPQDLARVDVNLQICLRATQVAVLAKRGRNVLPTLEMLDTLVARVGGKGWGVAVAASGLAIHLVFQHPNLANKYLLQALDSLETARLPDGSAMPPYPYPLEHMLWASANNCKSDADVDSWLATISRYTPAQLETLKKSDLMEDNITILCDGIWLRVYQKPEGERDWGPVKKKLEEVEVTAHAIGFPLLEAAAVRTRVMVLAEWDKQIDGALALSESSLKRFDADDCRFLVMEVTGRQLFYAGRPREATEWLERALSCHAFLHSLWRRNVLITMAELLDVSDAHKAAEFTAEAVRVSKSATLESLYVEALAEHGMALWKAGEGRKSFEVFEEATSRLFAIRTDADNWKGSFARVFGVIAYFSSLAFNGKPQDGQVEPRQGLFLAGHEQAHTGYRAEQLVYICIRLAMFADGVGDISKAAAWIWRAIESAKEIPSAWDAVRLQSWHAISETLLSDDFVRAAQLVKVMTAVDADHAIARAKTSADAGASKEISETLASVSSAPPGAKTTLRVVPIVPVALRLASLQFRGGMTAATKASLAAIESVIPPEVQPENFVGQIRRALVDEPDWETLWNAGSAAFGAHEYASGLVLQIGAIDKAPIPQSLHLQVYVAQYLDGFFKSFPSLYREIIAPFFVAYWKRAIDESLAFRTALAYTQRQLQVADGTPVGTRKLLSAMRFCLGVKLPGPQMEWLDGSS